MATKFAWRAVLVAVVCVALAAPARAESIQTAGRQVEVGIVVLSVAIGVLVVVLIVHHRHKNSSITGCVVAGTNGLNVTDEKDKRTYAVSGDPVGIKPGERTTLEGKRERTGKTSTFDARTVIKDFGACSP